MLLKAYDEVRRAPDPSAAVEMALIRLCYAASLPGPEEALKALQSGEPMRGASAPSPSSPNPSGSGPSASGPSASGPSASGGAGGLRAVSGGGAVAQAGLRPVAQAAQRTVLQTFEDVMQLIDAKRDVTLKLDVERYVRLVDFKPGVIAFEPAPGAPANLPQRLSGKLKEWTGQPWMMDIQTGGQETGYERDRREEADVRAAIETDPLRHGRARRLSRRRDHRHPTVSSGPGRAGPFGTGWRRDRRRWVGYGSGRRLSRHFASPRGLRDASRLAPQPDDRLGILKVFVMLRSPCKGASRSTQPVNRI